MSDKKTRSWICTWNNPTKSFDEFWSDLSELNCTFLIGQKEKGANGTEHYQFFCRFKNANRIAFWKKYNKSIHAEFARDEQASIDYCSKEDSRIEGPWTFGQYKVDQKKFQSVAILAKKTVFEMGSELNAPQFNQAIKAVQTFNLLTADSYTGPRECFWLYGPTGVGKSRYVKSFNPFMKACNKWWDGYQQQQEVLIDDLEKDSKFIGHFLKLWGDPYGHLTGEVKNGTIKLSFQRLWITSNYSIGEVFPPQSDIALYESIKRRFIEHSVRADGSWALIP